jgi:hypothetical protein
MKIRYFFFVVLFSFFLTLITQAQVTNLQVNGVSSNFTMVSGGTISWNYNVPIGATAIGDVWYDANKNGIIDAGDILYGELSQTDGVANGNNGPGDGDGLANGLIILAPTVLGLAPGDYIIKFSENNVSVQIAGTVTPMPFPTYSLSGKITAPTGKSAANCIVEVSRSNNYSPNFWDAVTDVNGNYTIYMNSDTAGNPWQIRVSSEPYPAYVISPGQIMITISGNLQNLNFTLTAPSAQIGGLIKDDNGTVLSNQRVQLSRMDNFNNTNYQTETNTDQNGIFRFGLSGDNILANDHWRVWAGNMDQSGLTINQLSSIWDISSLKTGDSLFNNMTIYYTNSQITGVVKYNGTNYFIGSAMVFATAPGDVAESSVMTQGYDHTFTVLVSNKFSSYALSANYNGLVGTANGFAAPGDTGVVINITSIIGIKNENNSFPTIFSLNQNYPNPFNPSTTITFGIPERSNVNLIVYNQLGQQVAVLANEVMSPGLHSVNWKPVNLSSGIYFYKLNAGNFQSVKKLMLLK